MNFGGPVWHVSVKHPTRAREETIARDELAGVGDATLGEWLEVTERATHLRRRLSSTEEAVTGPLLDIRGTKEAWWRWESIPAKVRRIFPEPL